MEFRTRHIMFSFAGLVQVVSALQNDYTSIQTQLASYIPVLIGMADWISSQVQKYKGIYNRAAKPG